MKRLLIIIISLCFVLCACNYTEPKETTRYNTTTEKSNETSGIIKETTSPVKETSEKLTTSVINKETTTAQTGTETPGEFVYSDEVEGLREGSRGGFLDCGSRVLVLENESIRMCYYSKADSKLYTFCFDPLCDHGRKSDCTSGMLFCGCVCCETDKRLYFRDPNPNVRKFYSCAFDGTDIKLIYELEGYSIETSNEYNIEDDLRTYGKYIYMKLIDRSEDGKNGYLIYDTSTGQIIKAVDYYDEVVNIMFFYKGKIHVKMSGEYYICDPDFKNLEKDEFMNENCPLNFLLCYSYKSLIYGYRYEMISTYNYSKYNAAYNVETGEYIEFPPELNDIVQSQPVGIDDKGDPIYESMRYYIFGKDSKGRDLYTRKLYRVSMKDYSVSIFIDDPYIYTNYRGGEGRYFWFDGDTVIFRGRIYLEQEDGSYDFKDTLFKGTLDGNGKLTNIKEAEIY